MKRSPYTNYIDAPKDDEPMEQPTKKLSAKEKWLTVAEVIDGYRVVPRLFLALYGVLVYNLYTWFTSIETAAQQACDAALIKILLDHGEKLEAAQALACSVSGVTGGPTTEQAAFVTAIIGLATGVFGFYASTGKKWGGDKSGSAGG